MWQVLPAPACVAARRRGRARGAALRAGAPSFLARTCPPTVRLPRREAGAWKGKPPGRGGGVGVDPPQPRRVLRQGRPQHRVALSSPPTALRRGQRRANGRRTPHRKWRRERSCKSKRGCVWLGVKTGHGPVHSHAVAARTQPSDGRAAGAAAGVPHKPPPLFNGRIGPLCIGTSYPNNPYLNKEMPLADEGPRLLLCLRATKRRKLASTRRARAAGVHWL